MTENERSIFLDIFLRKLGDEELLVLLGTDPERLSSVLHNEALDRMKKPIAKKEKSAKKNPQ